MQGSQTGVYKADAIKVSGFIYRHSVRELTMACQKDIADSLNLTISDSVASSLASDVEYRINQVIEVRRFPFNRSLCISKNVRVPGSRQIHEAR